MKVSLFIAALGSLFSFSALAQNTLEHLAERVNQHYANQDLDSALYYAEIIRGNLCLQASNQAPCALWKNNVADLYAEMEKFAEARRFYLEACKVLSQQVDYQNDYVLILNNLGTLYRELEKPDSAAYYYKLALEQLPDKNPVTEYRMEVETNYAELLLAEHRAGEAVLMLQSALHTAKELPQVQETYLAQLHRNLGRAFELLRKSEEAQYHFEQAKKLKP